MKETLRRAVRTFFQAAAGYVAAHLAVGAAGFAKGDETLRGAVIMLAASAVACGLAAVMNLPQSAGKDGVNAVKDEKEEKEERSEKKEERNG